MADRGFGDPRQSHLAQHKLDPAFARQIQTWKDKETRTVPLRKGDVKFFVRGQVIYNDAEYQELAQADAATITLENKKNGYKGAVLHHFASGKELMSPVSRYADFLYVSPLSHTYFRTSHNYETYHPFYPKTLIIFTSHQIETCIN